jgi:2-oxoglutarate ferredoxin oxidoreductase subunit gamma
MTQEHEIIFAGFGGQGVLSMGRLIAYAGMIEGKEVSWMPSYGPEMRGGTANCIVIVSDSRISSPIVTKFDTAILLNQPSIDKFMNNQPQFIRRQEQTLILFALQEMKKLKN